MYFWLHFKSSTLECVLLKKKNMLVWCNSVMCRLWTLGVEGAVFQKRIWRNHKMVLICHQAWRICVCFVSVNHEDGNISACGNISRLPVSTQLQLGTFHFAEPKRLHCDSRICHEKNQKRNKDPYRWCLWKKETAERGQFEDHLSWWFFFSYTGKIQLSLVKVILLNIGADISDIP